MVVDGTTYNSYAVLVNSDCSLVTIGLYTNSDCSDSPPMMYTPASFTLVAGVCSVIGTESYMETCVSSKPAINSDLTNNADGFASFFDVANTDNCVGTAYESTYVAIGGCVDNFDDSFLITKDSSSSQITREDYGDLDCQGEKQTVTETTGCVDETDDDIAGTVIDDETLDSVEVGASSSLTACCDQAAPSSSALKGVERSLILSTVLVVLFCQLWL